MDQVKRQILPVVVYTDHHCSGHLADLAISLGLLVEDPHREGRIKNSNRNGKA